MLFAAYLAAVRSPPPIFVAELLDHLDADPAAIDRVLSWLGPLDLEIGRAFAGDFPRPPLHVVPRGLE